MSQNSEIIREFIQVWSELDTDKLVSYFTSDGVYHNMPMGPVAGQDNLRKFIGEFLSAWTATDWELLNLVESGDIVIAERMDRTQVGDKRVDLPCCGVFEMRDGKIAVWRDYFDMQTYVSAMS
jgi:limonene-1,2-epoxide hydrolase